MVVPSDPSLFRLPRTLSAVRPSSVSPVVRRSATGSSPSVQTNVSITRYVSPPSSRLVLMSRAETSRPTYERQFPTMPMSTLTMSVERLLISCFPSPSDTERSHVAVPSPVCSHPMLIRELISRIQRGGAIEAQELGRDRLQPSTRPGYVSFSTQKVQKLITRIHRCRLLEGRPEGCR